MGLPKTKGLQLISDPANCTYFAGSLNIFALLYMIPFKVELDKSTNCFHLTTSRFRQIACGIIHCVVILLFIICGYMNCFTFDLSANKFESVIYTLDFAMNILFTLAVMKTLWRDQDLVEKFLNTPSYRLSSVPQRKVWLAAFSCILLFICDLHLNRTSGVSGCHVLTSHFVSNSGFVQACISIWNFIISFIVLISQLFVYTGEGICCTLAINIWEICRNLERKLRLDTPFKQGIEIYNEHRLTVEAVNSFSSTLFVTNLMSSLVYYAQAPIVYYFGHPAYHYEKAIMVAYIFITLMIWGFAGECHARTRKTIKKWVNRMQEKPEEFTSSHEQFQLAAISYNLDSDPIALSCCFFNVTYGFEASMLGLLISYNVIVFQMEEQGSTIKPSTSVTQ